MKTYLVHWELDVEATDPVSAAREALAIMQRPDTTATVFDVVERLGGSAVKQTRVDLLEIDSGEDSLEVSPEMQLAAHKLILGE